jgi:dihydrolipoamide dehydrogenase
VKKRDLVIIGGGPAGYAAALRAAACKQKVTLIEKKGLGGTCLFSGCIPTKIIIHHLKLFSKIKSKENFGIKVDSINFSLKQLLRKKNEKINSLSQGIENLFKKNKIDFTLGEAVLSGGGQIKINDQILKAQKIILAPGSTPVIPANFSYDLKNVITSSEALNLEEIPRKIIVIGAGAVGVEWATIFALLGSEVILIEALEQILPGVDSEIVRQLSRQFEKQKIKIVTNAFVENVKVSDHQSVRVLLKSGEIFEAEKVSIALGRQGNIPATENFKFKEINGYLAVDKNLQTSEPNIFAAGDITGPPLLAHRASFQGKKLAEFLSGEIPKIPAAPIPFCIFSFLEIGSVGLTQKEAEEKNLNFGIVRLPFGTLGIAQALEESEGLVKVIFEKPTKKILGIHIAGEYASFVLGQAVILINIGGTLETLNNLVQAHPTFSEILGSLPEFNWA